MNHESSDTDDRHVEGHPNVKYFSIFIALCVCTLLSVLFDLIHLPPILLITLVLAVATAKALFVITYFMHLKFEGRWKYTILTPTVILAMGLVVGLAPDIGMSYYARDVPQAGWTESHSHHKEGEATPQNKTSH
ncbi:MAG TPA: cytochrome C oxidase subunit IV family protein [Planctomicrobium sp.]|nr:cytochrome C oxidase subunit IV family protein [Planctomicrobium sp.]